MIYYAIGDIHGMRDTFLAMVNKIRVHANKNFKDQEYKIVLLGDYVDRGDNSRGVIEELMKLDDQFIILPGNHETMMFSGFQNIDDGSFEEYMMWWGRNGGFETLVSYFPDDHDSRDIENWQSRKNCVDWMVQFVKEFPDHYDWLHKCVTNQFNPTGQYHYIDFEDRIMFVHAGIQPHRMLKDQDEQTFLWGRDVNFLKDRMKWVQEDIDMVVHGHTIMLEGNLADHRSSLDTGAYHTGHMMCGVFVNGQRVDTIIEAGPPSELYHSQSGF